MKDFQENQKIIVPFNGERVDATIVDVLNTMVFVNIDSGGQGFFFKAEVLPKKEND